MALKANIITAALLVTASALTGCAYDTSEEPVGSAEQDVDGVGYNDLDPHAIDAQLLARGILNNYNITSSTNGDPLPLCKGDTVTDSGCAMTPEWESWMVGNGSWGQSLFKAIVKCAVESTFTIANHDGSLSFAGQWPLYPGWKTNRLGGQDKHERVSSCILSLLNGNNLSLKLGILGPGGAPFSDAVDDSSLTVREGGYFGDLFAVNPTAYVVGPNTAPQQNNGRACYSATGTYCCAETDSSCTHHIVLAGSMTGTNARCDGFATSGGLEFCTSFHSTREPGRTYANVFTTFIPPAQ